MWKIFKILKFVIKRYFYSFVIRKMDRKSDNLAQNSVLFRNGFEILTVDDLFDDKSFCEKLSYECKIKGSSSIDMTWELPDVFWNQILNSQSLSKKVKEYLGANVRIDDAYLKTIKDDLKSVSEGWHNDNVGYRLKLFIVFDVEGEPAPTVVLPTARPSLYKFNIIEDTARIIFERSSTSNRLGQVVVNYQGGTCLLFDTNIEHRGGYSESRGVRHCIVVEFIDREKAEKIKQFSPCGPLQGKGRIRISGKPELIEKSDLLDKSILNKVRDDLFDYG